MKKCFVYLLLAALSFLSCYGLFACRSFKKHKSSADSTVTRSEQQRQAWQAETIQEIVIESDEFPFVQPGTSLPTILGVAPQEPVGVLERLGFTGTHVKPISARPPGKKKGVAKVTLRRIARESSQQSSQLNEKKDVSTVHLDKSREPNAFGRLSILLIAVALLVIIILLYKFKHPD